jgi:hypothetical protein
MEGNEKNMKETQRTRKEVTKIQEMKRYYADERNMKGHGETLTEN